MVWGGGFLSGVEGGLADLIFTGDGGAEVAPIDYAGGTVVHINAGVAGLVLALLIGKRLGFGKEPMRPHNLTLTMIGAGLLWFGWFGFNVGSIVFTGTDEPANIDQFMTETGLVWLNTTLATCAAMLGWLLVEKIRDGKAHLARRRIGRRRRPGRDHPGVRLAVAAGLDRPRCWSPVASAPYAVGLKYKFGYDDSLDVVGVHLVGGLVGTIGIGFLATSGGLFYGDGIKQLVIQFSVALFAIFWSAVATLIVGLAIKVTHGLADRRGGRGRGHRRRRARESAYDLAAPAAAARRIARPPSMRRHEQKESVDA